jgi:cobalt-zinc-cadmium efflux system membrane fusion protein
MARFFYHRAGLIASGDGSWTMRACCVVLSIILSAPGAWAHETHDEQSFSANARPAQPTSNNDGSLTIPLAAQTGLSIKTVARADVSQVHTLPARVIADPRHSALVSVTYSAMLSEPKNGFPQLGQRIGKGDVLAVLKPSLSNIDLSDIKSDLAIVERDKILLQRQIDIYAQNLGHAPASDDTSPIYQRMKSDFDGAVGRLKAYTEGMTYRGELRAPMSGEVSSSNLYVGRVVVPGDEMMEIVEPGHLWVSALSYDTRVEPPLRTYAYTSGKQRITLALVGKSLRLQGQALPLQYEVVQSPVKLAVGQALTLYLDNLASTHALSVPSASLKIVGTERALIWVQTGVERFVPRQVGVKPDGNAYAIVSGVRAGEKVVTGVPRSLQALFSKP